MQQMLRLHKGLLLDLAAWLTAPAFCIQYLPVTFLQKEAVSPKSTRPTWFFSNHRLALKKAKTFYP